MLRVSFLFILLFNTLLERGTNFAHGNNVDPDKTPLLAASGLGMHSFMGR